MTEIRSLARELRAAPWRLNLLHSAAEHRLVWITQGQGRVLLNADRRGIGTHNILFVPAGQSFAMEATQQTTGHLVLLEPESAAWPGFGHLLRTRDVQSQGEIAALLEALAREQSGAEPHREEAMEAQTRLLSVWLRRRIAETEEVPPPDTGSAAQGLIAAFLADLERLYPTGAPMADYAARLDVTPTHLSRVCKSRLGRSAARLVTERTLHAARRLLETTGHPVGTIASELGFGSAAYFSRFIHGHTGQTPRDLRAASAPRTGPGGR